MEIVKFAFMFGFCAFLLVGALYPLWKDLEQ
ncbi:MAG: hypothetical protein RLZZ93_1551 [Actinomycetota bacterium]